MTPDEAFEILCEHLFWPHEYRRGARCSCGGWYTRAWSRTEQMRRHRAHVADRLADE